MTVKKVTLRFGPILPREILDPAKLSRIGCDERHLVSESLSSDQQIIFAYRPADHFHLRSKFTCKSRVFFIEHKPVHWSGKKAGEELNIHFATLAL